MINSREYPSRPFCAVGVVVRRGNAVLLIQRANPPRRGEWGLPGGVIELGETMRETARREVLEECGITIKVGNVIDAVDIIQCDESGRVQYHYLVVDLAAVYVNGDIHPASDVMDTRWVALDELRVLNLSKRTYEVIDKSLKQLSPGLTDT